MIRVTDLKKSYGPVQALGGVSLHIAPGEVLGLLGANGSGKTTLNRCIATLIQADEGQIEVGGHCSRTAPNEVRQRLGYLAEYPILYPSLSAEEFLAFVGGLRDLSVEEAREQADRWLALFELTEAAKKPMRGYSQGMGRKVALAAALLGEPQAVLLDEPTNGLDPPSVYLFRKVIERLREQNRAVLLSSHVLPLVQQACDRIAVLVEGRIVARGTLDELRAAADRPGADLEALFLHFSGLDREMLQRLADAGLSEGPGVPVPAP
ncbi:MAG: ABC transporter ATP-binding protein [Myxococcota bacterium]|nr:ABC transporter ATP-binding protein [Myxococcota bacterium]